jgi:hypothetical protein
MSSPAASAKGKEKPASKSKWIIALGWLVSSKVSVHPSSSGYKKNSLLGLCNNN